MLRPLKSVHLKYFDDATPGYAVDLKNELCDDLEIRQSPLTWNERARLVLPDANNGLQRELDGFDLFVKNNSFKVNHDKTKVIMFSPSYK